MNDAASSPREPHFRRSRAGETLVSRIEHDRGPEGWGNRKAHFVMTQAAAGHRTSVLLAYRELLSLIRRLPVGEHGARIAEARAAVRANAGEASDEKKSDMLKLMWSKISFLRMVCYRCCMK